MNYLSIHLQKGRYKGRWLAQVPENYRNWLLATAKTREDVANINIRLSTGPFKERRLSSLNVYELEAVANDEDTTSFELDAVKSWAAEIPPDQMRVENPPVMTEDAKYREAKKRAIADALALKADD